MSFISCVYQMALTSILKIVFKKVDRIHCDVLEEHYM
jgi:hypothetical protein